ncbi:hypothetical protein EKN06_08420 [Croceicoccus ponticola]|uniref:Uncharacterized protein n=1 Tax=Croceicoccus ponticola TaxID=2217664 RepID=A0A437GXR0_9SPHN|nr:hypothetical protein [Croceicoccus ponticola]RVQ66961.1 hypothetical protein EKN06_08420 [Croceicoccus ponticola]
MQILISSFIRGLPALPLLLAALYMLSITAVSPARELARQLLRLRIVFTLVMSTTCLTTLLVPGMG